MISALKFERVGSTKPSESLSFDDFIRAITTDTPAKKRCRELKSLYVEAIKAGSDGRKEKDAYDAVKLTVPPWLLGARLNGPRCIGNVIPEGYVTVDFDDVEDTEGLKNTLSLCPHVMLAAYSLGGRGVFCIVPTTPEIQKDPAKIKILWKELSNYTGISLGSPEAKGKPHIDTACSDSSRLRFESYDPWPVYNAEAQIWKPFLELSYECYIGSRVHEIAQCFGGSPDGGHENGNARNAFALSAISMIARARVYGESPFLRGLYFPFKAQTVVLGCTGANKGVTLDALRAVAGEFGVTRIRSASDAMLIDIVSKSVATCETLGKGKTAEIIWKPRPESLAILEIIDEAGDDKAARKNREYTSQATDLRRQLFNETTELGAALSRPAPSFPVKAAYTNIQLSTPQRWAENINDGDGDAGDARRVSEFWLPSPVENEDTSNPVVIGKLMRSANFNPADVPRITDILTELDDRGSVRMPSNVSDWVLDGALPYLGGAIPEETQLNVSAYRTLAVSFATACAYARGGDRVEDWDFLAGTSLFLGVMDTRRRIEPLTCKTVNTPQSSITNLIIKTLRAAGSKGMRMDTLTGSRGKCASPDHIKVLQLLIAEGVVVQYKALTSGRMRSMLRLATDEEIARLEEKAEADKKKNTAASESGTQRAVADFGPYSGCSSDEKRSRVRAYIDQFKNDHPFYPGMRNLTLWRLRVLLQRKNDMWDAIAQEEYLSTARETGLPEREVKSLMRARIDGNNPLDDKK